MKNKIEMLGSKKWMQIDQVYKLIKMCPLKF